MIPAVNGVCTPGEGSFFLPQSIGIGLAGMEESCISAFLDRTGRTRSREEKLRLRIRRDEALAPEEYRMRITSEDIRIRAGSERGAIWALTTIVNKMRNNRIPCATIADQPKLRHRGLMVDCARHFFPAEEIKRIIEQIARAKMNVLHWHLADDQGWRIQSDRFPLLHETSGQYYTKEEICDVVRFAGERGVEVIPEIDLPGHTLGILAAYPEHSCGGKPVRLADRGGIYKTILCAGKESTYGFLEELLGEVCELFPSEYFHIGGDEAPKSEWKTCPDCQKKKEELGLAGWEDLQGYFAGRVADLLKKYGKKPVCWNDLLQTKNVPEGMRCQYWTVEYAEQTAEFARRGGEWIYSDMFEIYFDYPYSMSPLKKVYETTPHFGKKPCGKDEGPVGMEACVWTEQIRESESLEERIFPRIYAVAELSWSGRGKYREFEKRLEDEVLRLRQDAIHVMQKERWNPGGKERREEAFAFLKAMGGTPDDAAWAESVEMPEPGKEFVYNMATKFFRPSDLPALMKMYRR